MQIFENSSFKALKSNNYNYAFAKVTGAFVRWGASEADDPDWSPFGPELADIEISSAAPEDLNSSSDMTVVTNGGCNGVGCKKFCYKQNVSNKTVHMTLDAFKKIMNRMPPTLTQIAFGICSINSNPDVWKIFEETRKRGLVPNVTVNGQGITDGVAANLSRLCGAVAVSVNPDNKEMAYNAVKKLSQDYGMSQVNFHVVLSPDTVDFIKGVVDDIKSDSRLSNLNALVMLAFKDKGNTKCFSSPTVESHSEVVNYCDSKGVAYGFDSCSAPMYLQCIKNKSKEEYDKLSQHVEPCESGLFSAYINVFGNFYVCSFAEGEDCWQEGMSVLDCDSFLEDIWLSDRLQAWRQRLLSNKRSCPIYNLGD